MNWCAMQGIVRQGPLLPSWCCGTGADHADRVMVYEIASVQCIIPAVNMVWHACRGSYIRVWHSSLSCVPASLWLTSSNVTTN